MFSFLRKLFSRKKSIKNFSTTLTDATEGVNSRKEFSPELKKLMKSFRKKPNINNEELNQVLQYYFNVPPIVPGLYNINKSFVEGMCFDICNVNTVYDDKGDIANIFLSLREVTFNNDLVITVSVKDFHETLNFLNFQPEESKG